MTATLILQILQIISAVEPEFISIWNSFKASGMNVGDYVADIQARDAAASAAANAQIAKDQAQISGTTPPPPATPVA